MSNTTPQISKEIQRRANAFARKNGSGTATEISFEEIDAPRIVSTTAYGYRKYTTGEYVPNAYRAKFGWKNTYYQSARCHVAFPLSFQNL